MTRTYRILVNPASGGGTALKRLQPVATILRDAGAVVSVVHSLGVEHCRKEVAAATEAGETVVACGGDGMLASIGAEMVATGAPLGIIPSGRGNDFARMLRIEGEPEQVAHHLLEGDSKPVDVIRVGDKVVLGSVYAGVDSLASELVNGAHRLLPSSLQYPYAAVRALLTYQPTRYTLNVDDSSVSLEAYSVVIANSGYYGKGMHVAPSAVIDDGILDVVVIPKVSRFKLIRLMPKIYDGTHVDLAEVHTFRGTKVTLSAKDRVVAFGDGEPLMDLPVTAEITPGALRVLLA